MMQNLLSQRKGALYCTILINSPVTRHTWLTNGEMSCLSHITSTIGEFPHEITIFGNSKYSNSSSEIGHFLSLQGFWHHFMMCKQ